MGTKSIGKIGINVPIPTIANAIRDAIPASQARFLAFVVVDLWLVGNPLGAPRKAALIRLDCES